MESQPPDHQGKSPKPLISDKIPKIIPRLQRFHWGNHYQGCAERVTDFLPLVKSTHKKQEADVMRGEGWDARKSRGEALS